MCLFVGGLFPVILPCGVIRRTRALPILSDQQSVPVFVRNASMMARGIVFGSHPIEGQGRWTLGCSNICRS
ncbi:hypothetical protein MTBLM5_10188 [Magnetospirillum sp. LM-5]|nr:hypothetical protein MTBLM5_10188 [Magnetospirillum sp. LM-5]